MRMTPKRDSPFPALVAVLAAGVAAVAGLAGAAGEAEAQVVTGRVLDAQTDSPIPWAWVALADSGLAVLDAVVTDQEGAFSLRAEEPGDYFLLAQRLGYQQGVERVVQLEDGESVEIALRLRPEPIEVDALTARVSAQRTQQKLELAGYYEREKAGFGHFISPEELEERQPADTRELLRGIPGVQVTDGRLAGQTVLCNRRAPVVFVDGARTGWATSSVVLEDVAHVRDIAAVEIYRRASEIPLQYQVYSRAGQGAPACVILVWTVDPAHR